MRFKRLIRRTSSSKGQIDAKPVTAGGDSKGLQQRAERNLAGPSFEIINAVRAGVEAMHDQRVIAGQFKPPGLRVVAARRPAREVEDLAQDSRLTHPCSPAP